VRENLEHCALRRGALDVLTEGKFPGGERLGDGRGVIDPALWPDAFTSVLNVAASNLLRAGYRPRR
jgi:hypothetical protein